MLRIVRRYVKEYWFDVACKASIFFVMLYDVVRYGLGRDFLLIHGVFIIFLVVWGFRFVEFLVVAYYFVKWDSLNFIEVSRLFSIGDERGLRDIFATFNVLGFTLYDLRDILVFSIFRDFTRCAVGWGYLPILFEGSNIESVLGDRYIKYIWNGGLF